MPVQYSGVIDEHKCVRNNVGLFDISHMGRIEIRGDSAESFLQRLTTNDLSKLETNQVQYSLFCYPDGGIVDDITVYRLGDNRFMVCVNAVNREKNLDWIGDNNREKADIVDLSGELCQLAIQGKNAEEVMQKISDIDLSSIKYFWFKRGEVDGVQTVISRTGYTGEDGFELYFNSEKAVKIWNAIFNAGEKFGIRPIGLGARDTLRLEMKYLLYGNDIDSQTTPLEADIGWVVRLNKKDFIGKEALFKQKEKGIDKKLIGFEAIERGIPRSKYPLYYQDKEIGFVTSGTMSPSLNRPIGMGYIKAQYSDVGTVIDIRIRERRIKARIVSTPFYSAHVKKSH